MAVNVCFGTSGLSNKKSIFDGPSLRILFIFSIIIGTLSCADAQTPVSCSSVRNVFNSKGMLSMVDFQEQPNSDAGGLCLNQGCCGANARPKLTAQARTQLEKTLRTEITKLADILASRAVRFDEFFRRLLQESREEFHAMFKRTYGMIYEQHSYVFEQLFEQLERYYLRGDVDLVATMNHFFGVLYEKMFTVLNSQYSFDDKYLQCVTEHMRDTQPFDDVPNKLSVQLRRAFVATRTFHKALRQGADLVRAMLKLGVSEECAGMWARLQWCGACGGHQAAPACSRYCHNVLRGCLPRHADLSTDWDAYVDAVDKVADRLLGPFNIVMVVEPIDIKISEAIMNFQEHNQEISQKIFAGCGKPVLGERGAAGPFFAPDRSRRAVAAAPGGWARGSDVDDFEIDASFESVMQEDPALLELQKPSTTIKMQQQAESRGRFLRYMRGEIDYDAYEEHERRRRDAEPEPDAEPHSAEIDFKPYEFEGKRKPGKKTSTSTSRSGEASEWGGPVLERVVREARARVRNSRRYWEHLPYLACSEVAAQPSAHCFNGTHRASYTLSAAGAGSAALASNPEVSRAPGSAGAGAGAGGDAGGEGAGAPHAALRLLTARLKDAYNGVDVVWRDSDDLRTVPPLDLVERAGSGSGSGDDDRLPDDDDDEDHDAGGLYPGSGDGPPDLEGEEDDSDADADTDTDTDTDTERSTETRLSPPSSLPPVVVGGGDDARNVRIGGRAGLVEEESGRALPSPAPPAPPRDRAATDAADRPSLHRALISYALPVVCAWFGTIVTDLF